MALGHTLRTAMDNRRLWDDLIDMRLLDTDKNEERESVKEFYRHLTELGVDSVPGQLVGPCMEAFRQQRWEEKGRSNPKLPGLPLPQPRLDRNRFTGQLYSRPLMRKIVRFRYDKAVILNTLSTWPENRQQIVPFGYRIV